MVTLAEPVPSTLPAHDRDGRHFRGGSHFSQITKRQLEHLATKFAEAQPRNSCYVTGRTANRSLNLGCLPARILRLADLLEYLVDIYDTQCQTQHRQST
jgi:hypothetical protein